MDPIMETSALTVFLYALITAIATGIGAFPFFFFKKVTKSTLGLCNAAAGGLMLAASFTLIEEGKDYGIWLTALGILLGLVFIIISNRFLESKEDLSIANLRGFDARKAILILGVMTVHSFTEGVGVGVSFGGNEGLGIFITAAIAIHNIPEGLAIALILIPRGMNVWTVILLCIFSSIPQPIMAVPAYVFVEWFHPFLPVGLGFAAGAMIWMVFSEIIPDANEQTSSKNVGLVLTLSVMLMFLFQEYLR